MLLEQYQLFSSVVACAGHIWKRPKAAAAESSLHFRDNNIIIKLGKLSTPKIINTKNNSFFNG